MIENSTPSAANGQPQSFQHVILTRFNVRWDEAPDGPSIGTDPDWLANRFRLFERYCLPSVLGQSRPDFSWILFFDHQTPEPYAERARALAALRPGIHPIFCRTLPNDLVSETVAKVVPTAPAWLLTTRLDNDDGLHEDFVAGVQDAQSLQQAEVLNCPVGIVLCGDRAYRQRHPSNAFISLSEPFSERRTIFSIKYHIHANRTHPVRQLAPEPMWLQVIHGGNVSNRVRGRRVPLGQASAGFPALADRAPSAAAESRASILAENLTGDLVRLAYDLARAALRHAFQMMGVTLRRRAKMNRATAGER